MFPSKNLIKAQSAYRLINDLKIVLPIVTLGLLGLGVAAARGHRRALIGAGLGFAASTGLSTGPVGRWTYAHRHGLRIAAVALAALVFVFWGHPTAPVTIVIAVLLLVVLGLIELIGRPPPNHAPAPPAPSG